MADKAVIAPVLPKAETCPIYQIIKIKTYRFAKFGCN